MPENVEENTPMQDNTIRLFLNDIKGHFDGKELSAGQLADSPDGAMGYRGGLGDDPTGHGKTISRALDVIRDGKAGEPDYDRLKSAMEKWHPEGEQTGREFIREHMSKALPKVENTATKEGPEAKTPETEAKKPEEPKAEAAKAAPEESKAAPKGDEPKREAPSAVRSGTENTGPREREAQQRGGPVDLDMMERMEANARAREQAAYQAGQQNGAQTNQGPTHRHSYNSDLLGLGKGVTGAGNAAVNGIRATSDSIANMTGRSVDKVTELWRGRSQNAMKNMENSSPAVQEGATAKNAAPPPIAEARENARERAGEDYRKAVGEAHEAALNKDQKAFDKAYTKMGESLSTEMTKDGESLSEKGGKKNYEAARDRYEDRERDLDAVNKVAEENGIKPNEKMKHSMKKSLEDWSRQIKELIQKIADRIKNRKNTAENTASPEV